MGRERKLQKLGSVLVAGSESRWNQQARERRKSDRRTTFVIMKYLGSWRTPVHKTLKKLKRKFGFGWLRPRMVYKWHRSLVEMLLADIATIWWTGNAWSGDCRTRSIIYKITCKCCGNVYIGKTQDLYKKRVSNHINDVGKFWAKWQQLGPVHHLVVDELGDAQLPVDDEVSTSSSITTRSRLNQPAQ